MWEACRATGFLVDELVVFSVVMDVGKEKSRIFAVMRIYFYHTEDTQYIYGEWEKGQFPGHFLYGATHLREHGIDMIMHKHRDFSGRLRAAVYVLWQILKNYGKIDAVYATHYKFLELVIFLRALGLFRKPVVIWHHQPIITPKKKWREWLGRLFYRGIDDMFFFSQKLYDDSLKTKKARQERMHVGHWGADMDYYDRIMKEHPVDQHVGFISTGRERRDMKTLVAAFNETDARLDIYLNKSNCGIDYEQMFRNMEVRDNVNVHFMSGYQQANLSATVYHSACVVICCLETRYTVGLTTVVEALAFGLPIICSRNPQIPVDFDKEKCGITVPYYDKEGWIRAIRYVQEHPDEARKMGQRARQLAEQMYNDRRCAAEVAQVLKKYER